MAFGDVVRSIAAHAGSSEGAGGDSSKIWYCSDTDNNNYELKTSDLSVSRSAAAPGEGGLSGIGGDSSKIWHCDLNSDDVFELKTSDLSASRSASSPDIKPGGIGGDSSKIWHCDYDDGGVYELKTSDLSVSRSAAAPGTSAKGIGGDSSTIWHCNNSTDGVYELKTSDLSVSRSASSPSALPSGIGGDSSVIWHCDRNADKIYELVAVAIVAPTVSTVAADNIGQTKANPKGNVTATGGENPTRYIDYDIDSGAPYANSENCGVGGTGVYNSNLTGLIPGKKYYYRARAVNSEGTGTGSEMTFTTLSIAARHAHMAAKMIAEKMI